ncbi:TetR/AcrR family transcriptional regulator [Ilumatobacter sp.]|uniref:TetR/AcrR family transcriptional regulator n=1 Tax=Ilumatobacter sp. TaxID=1967498 RepID=UPI003B517FA5
MTKPQRAERDPLDRPSVVAAGIALADDDGVAALTMRGLAERLGFKVMALYNHVASKDELLALMVDAVAGSIELPGEHLPPLSAIRMHAIATREVFVRHPWVTALWQQHVPGPNRIDHMESLLRSFGESGLPADIAHHGFHAVNNHVVGYSLQELAMGLDAAAPDADAVVERFLATLVEENHPYTVAHIDEHLHGATASSFELVLDLILDGLVALPSRRGVGESTD